MMDRESLGERKRLWEGLKLHPAWKELMDMAAGQVEGRKSAVLDPMRPGQEYEREFLKGEISGIQTFMLLVDTAIETLEIEIQRVSKES
jgi:hypothetical protein